MVRTAPSLSQVPYRIWRVQGRLPIYNKDNIFPRAGGGREERKEEVGHGSRPPKLKEPNYPLPTNKPPRSANATVKAANLTAHRWR